MKNLFPPLYPLHLTKSRLGCKVRETYSLNTKVVIINFVGSSLFLFGVREELIILNKKIYTMGTESKKQEDTERIKRVLFLLYNSEYCLNFFEYTHKKHLGTLALKLDIIKSEKPRVLFKKAPRAKDITYVYLDLNIQHKSSLSNKVSKAKVSTEDALNFETEICKRGYTCTNQNKDFKIYELSS
jgi:hypothetical protein